MSVNPLNVVDAPARLAGLSTVVLLLAAAGAEGAVVSGTRCVCRPGWAYRLAGPGGGGGGGGGAGGVIDFNSALGLITISSLDWSTDDVILTPGLAIGSTSSGTSAGEGVCRYTDPMGVTNDASFSMLMAANLRTTGPGNGGTRQTMDIELTDVDMIALPSGVRLRESPTLASLGQAHIDEQPDGSFVIDSFFDVFFDLSLDGGQSWIPAQTSARMELVPAPSAAALFGLGLLAAGRRRRVV